MDDLEGRTVSGMRREWTTAAAVLVLAIAGCGGGMYGHDRDYETLSAEDDLLEKTTETTYEDVRRTPSQYRSAKLGWFGVVEDITPVGEARVRLTLSYRTLQPRNYCSDETSGSCRVTVSERDGGTFIAFARIRTEDEVPGPSRLAPGSLLRIFGHPHGELMKVDVIDASDPGVPVIEGEWYRHWPRTEYVTTGAAAIMRR